MTSPQKVGAGAGAIILAILTLVLGAQSLPVLQWLFGEVKLMAALPMFGPTAMAAVVGVFAQLWFPYMLPATWEPHKTKRVVRLLGFSLPLLMVFWRYPNAVGFQYGIFAGAVSYMLWTVLAGLMCRVAPDKQPESLKSDGT